MLVIIWGFVCVCLKSIFSPGNASIIDQNVHHLEFLFDPGERLLNRFGIGNIAFERMQIATMRFHGHRIAQFLQYYDAFIGISSGFFYAYPNLDAFHSPGQSDNNDIGFE